jgi:hypothetical protein
VALIAGVRSAVAGPTVSTSMSGTLWLKLPSVSEELALALTLAFSTNAPVTGRAADVLVSGSPHGPAHLEHLAIGVVPSRNSTFPGQGCCPRIRGPDSARGSMRTRTERAPSKTRMR